MIKIDIEKLPEISDNATTQSEAREAIGKYGNPVKIVFKYRTLAIVSLGYQKWLYIPNNCLTVS